MVDPHRDTLGIVLTHDGERTLLGQPRLLAAQLLALLARQRALQIGGRPQRRGQHRALLALDQHDPAALSRADSHESVRQCRFQRQDGSMEKG